jgi:hypothetical protein
MTVFSKVQSGINPRKGTAGGRDPSIIPDGATKAGKKWYIIGTDHRQDDLGHFTA